MTLESAKLFLSGLQISERQKDNPRLTAKSLFAQEEAAAQTNADEGLHILENLVLA